MRKGRYRMKPETKVLLKNISIGFLVIGLLALLITGIWHSTRLSAVTLDSISVSGGETISHLVVEQIVQNELSGTYLGLIPKRFTWFYPENQIHQSVNELDRVHSVVVDRKKREVQVTFDEYIPFALWCAENSQDQGCLFLDRKGFAFSQAPDLSGGSYLRFVTSGNEMEVDKQALETDVFDRVNLLVSLLAENSWYINRVELDNVGDAYLSVAGGGELKVTVADEPNVIIENLLVLLSSPEFTHIKPGNFQYIDLRFGSKVFVNEVPLVDIDADAGTSTEEEIVE